MQDYRNASNLASVSVLVEDDRVMVVLANGAVRAAYAGSAMSGVPLISANSTPANSAIDVSAGRMFCDDSYLYVATSANTVKRVALESF